MVKKVMLALLILILLCIVGITCLILFVNPNHFRSLISETIEEKTGYVLTIEGDLRWHIWPQISILTGAVRLEDEGAQKPLLSADNMRLDVALWPLFSKKLDVKTIFAKSATVNITDESKGKVHKRKSAMVSSSTASSLKTEEPSHSKWSYSLKKLELDDSTLILQIGEKENLNFRNLNLMIAQKNPAVVAMTLQGTLNRDQRDFNYDLMGTIGIHNFPECMPINISRFSYQIQGADLPKTGLSGEITAAIAYQKYPLRIQTRHLTLKIGESTLTGKIGYSVQNNHPMVLIQLEGDTLDLTPFGASSKTETAPPSPMSPVMTATDEGNQLNFLTRFDADLTLKIRKIFTKKLILQNGYMRITNRNGVAELNPASFNIAQGTITLTGRANGNIPRTYVELQTVVSHIALEQILKELNISDNISGTIQGRGIFKTDSLKRARWLSALRGDMDFSIKHARLDNLNMQQIIQMAVAQVSKDAVSSKLQEKYTEFHELSASADLMDSQLTLDPLVAVSETLSASGKGTIDLLKKNVDIRLNVKILSGWNEKSETIAKLQKVTIPLRVYGQLSQLHYQVDLNKILQDQWQKGLNKLKDKYLFHLSSDT